MNVAFGGTLHPYIDDLENRSQHTIGDASTDPNVRFAPAHEIVIDPSSQVISKLLTKTSNFIPIRVTFNVLTMWVLILSLKLVL